MVTTTTKPAGRNNSRPGRGKNSRPGTVICPENGELARLIDRLEKLEEKFKSHQRIASEIEENVKKLAGVASDGLLKVEKLEEIVENLTAAVNRSSIQSPKLELDENEKKVKILIVDDDQTSVKIVAHFLERENFRVLTSSSGADGLKKAFQERPDLILLDIMMSDLNGIQFLSIFHKDEQCALTPVIILSSLTGEADVLMGLETGAVDYITKPFAPSILLAKIKKTLNLSP